MMTITGVMRSATSLAALTANQNGVKMGSTMVMPIGSLNEEYEDMALAGPLTRSVFGDEAFEADRVFGDYVETRQREFEQLNQISPLHAWGFKSPLLMLYWDEWKRATDGIPQVTVVTSRCLAAAMRSLQLATELAFSLKNEFRSNMLKRVRKIERDLFAARKDVVSDANYVITYDDLRADAVGSMAGAIRAAGGG
jgi:hypothetical protein